MRWKFTLFYLVFWGWDVTRKSPESSLIQLHNFTSILAGTEHPLTSVFQPYSVQTWKEKRQIYLHSLTFNWTLFYEVKTFKIFSTSECYCWCWKKVLVTTLIVFLNGFSCNLLPGALKGILKIENNRRCKNAFKPRSLSTSLLVKDSLKSLTDENKLISSRLLLCVRLWGGSKLFAC